MVEMLETSAILNHSTKHSLVLMDEVGRGTSYDDGMAIAWAAIRHLCNNVKCRVFFATHFHELALLFASHPRVDCVTTQVIEQAVCSSYRLSAKC